MRLRPLRSVLLTEHSFCVALLVLLVPAAGHGAEPTELAGQLEVLPPARAGVTPSMSAATVTIEATLCPGAFSLTEFLELLRVELGGREVRLQEPGLREGARPVPFLAIRESSCGAGVVSITLGRSASRGGVTELRTELDLRDVARNDRPRTLAIAAAELVRTLLPEPQSERELNSGNKREQSAAAEGAAEPASESAPKPGGPSISPASSAPARGPWSLAGELGLGLRSSWAAPWLGAAFTFRYQTTSPLRFWVGAVAAHSEVRLSNGRIDLWLFGPRLGVDATFRLGSAELALGAGLDASVVRAWGEEGPTGPEPPVWGFVLAPLVRSELSVPIGPHWTLLAALECGVYAREVHLVARGIPAARFAGITGAGVLGVAHGF